MDRSLGLMFAALLASAPASALAQEASPPAAETPTEAAAVPTPTPSTFSVRTGAAYIGGDHHGTSLLRADAFVGIGYRAMPRLTLAADLHFGTTRFAYNGSLDDGLSVDGTMWSYFDTSVEVSAAVELLRIQYFEMDAFAGFETTVVRTDPVVTDLRITTVQGSYDVGPYAKDNVGGNLYWYRVYVGAAFRLRFGDWTPGLGVAFEHLDATLDLNLTEDARDVTTRLGYDPAALERPHTLSANHVVLTPSLGFDFSRTVNLSVIGLIAPGFGTLHYGATAMVTIGL